MHAERNEGEPQDPVTSEVLAAAAKYFGGHPPQPTAQEVADYYRERNMLAVIFNVDDEAGMGRAPARQRRGARGRAEPTPTC